MPKPYTVAHKLTDPFYLSEAWKKLRYQRIKLDKWRCQHCGISVRGKKYGGATPHVDHVQPRQDNPDRELDIDALQTLCAPCHNRKTHVDRKDLPLIGADGYPV